MFKVLLSLLIFISFSVTASAQTGCLVLNFDAYSKVFNNHETATQFYTGNGNNFVWWEGVCGPHTYIATSGNSLGPCTLNGSTKTGQIYAISGTFTAPCGVPLDDYSIFMALFFGLAGTYVICNRRLLV
ncbi:hypothetical protein [Pedobacter kyungheensis]|uniref:hypothetical protein n=1 Tax=Pedobacter kyungheensis TaxID=1069985 RepID=UPI0012E052FA|nr:hypothetical protein [Pedobacter kyungheensis]